MIIKKKIHYRILEHQHLSNGPRARSISLQEREKCDFVTLEFSVFLCHLFHAIVHSFVGIGFGSLCEDAFLLSRNL